MTISTSRALSVALSLVVCTGCDKVIEMIQGGAEEIAGGGEGGGLMGGPKTEDDHLAEKLDPYIQCINDFSRRIHDTADRYLSWVNPETGVTGSEKNVYGLYELSDPQTCVDGVKTAVGVGPKDPDLESAGQAFADAVVAARAVEPVPEGQTGDRPHPLQRVGGGWTEGSGQQLGKASSGADGVRGTLEDLAPGGKCRGSAAAQ